MSVQWGDTIKLTGSDYDPKAILREIRTWAAKRPWCWVFPGRLLFQINAVLLHDDLKETLEQNYANLLKTQFTPYNLGE